MAKLAAMLAALVWAPAADAFCAPVVRVPSHCRAPLSLRRASSRAPPAQWAALAAKRGAAPVAKPHVGINSKFPGLKQVSKDPAIFTIDNFFDEETCERYLSLGPAGEASGLSLKVDSATFGGGFTAQNRQSTTWFLNFASAHELVAGALKLLPDRVLENCEEPQIVRYEMGDYFNWHEDALPVEEVQADTANGGQRLATLLVYLNDVPPSGGGATVFRHLKHVKVTPQRGKALLFFPAFADGEPDPRTEHAGSAAFDTKWIAQMWIHQATYKPAVPAGNSHSHLVL
jgi:hypothetical protein